MVDFQSRDTRRDRGTDDDSDEQDETTAESDEKTTGSGDTTAETEQEAGSEAEAAADEAHEHDEQAESHEHDHGAPHDHEESHEHEHSHHDHEESHDHDHDDSHGHHAHDLDTLGIAVVTVSSSRTVEDDPSGDAIVTLVESAGHEVASREVLADDYDRVQASVEALAERGDVDVVVTTGGTGVTPDDVTIEAVSTLFEKELPGFGELFRSLSFDDIGTMVVGTRATAGIVDETVVFCLPGSENAVRLGVEEIILEEAGHLAGLASRD
jgi:molybdenum cofactor biosynthesis protein B